MSTGGDEHAVGARDRGKTARRRHLSNVATQLFMERGFDAVTINEIAESAGLAKMTVWNYFPRKEDLMFDRHGSQLAMIEAVLAEAPPQPSVVEAMRRHELTLLSDRNPLSGVAPHAARFWEVIQGSAALTTRWHEHFLAIGDLLEPAFARERGPGIVTAVAASLVATTMEVVQTQPFQRAAAGVATRTIRSEQPRVVNDAFDLLRDGL